MVMAYVDVDKGTRPAGRKPLSRSTSHSYPRVPPGRVAGGPEPRLAIEVFRQNRILPSAAGTVMDQFVLSGPGPLTMKMVPESAFSGRPPSAGGLKRGSRHVPVHVGGSFGSRW